ncbi:MarR family transcriptional regulator [Spiribacter sp. 2438]|uniref:MarR family transcriptional regulator n=1 Tax=Spiribacter sp. 2438 TaxID=2666185 RepID=UPI0018A2000C|nr:MarR family transcriptional regulator [Spiribacter sp. 2438]
MDQDIRQQLECLFEAKRIWREAFRDEQSVIPMDIVLLTVWYHSQGPALSMKHLVAELPYSEAGIKYHLRQLEADGLVTRQSDPEDGRVVRLVPSDHLVDRVLSVTRAMKAAFNGDHHRPDGQMSMADVMAGAGSQDVPSTPPRI